ncbi:hypothetical protein [Glacieibacterium sp.]|uniref:VgrG-related protein n=1 Tax=Glacieibacterium sp. TaxID=2860237 RepID=UPI003B004A9A
MPGHRLGDLSMRFETGFRPGQEALACAVVSTGLLGQGSADPGGRSYGAYQLSSTVQAGQQVLAFLKAEGKPWATLFAGLDPTRAGRFAAAWKVVATSEAAAFFAAQHDFIQRTHFAVVVAKVRLLTRIDLSARCPAVSDVVWSMAVQHGRAAQLVTATIRALQPGVGNRALIDALYDRREIYVRALGLAGLVKGRYVPERRDALALLPHGE